MEKHELNRNIKRLKSYYIANKDWVYDSNDKIDYVRNEFNRLYRADISLSSVTKDNLLFMFRLNQRHRFIPLHQFGSQIECGI